MIARTLLFVALLLTGAAIAGPDRDDKTRLEGTWALQSLEVNGKKIAIKDLDGGKGTLTAARLVIKGEQYVFHLGKDRQTFTYQLHPTTTPAQIDLTPCDGAHKGKSYRGIYRLQANTYTICRHVDPEKERPRTFTTKPDSGVIIVVWERVKP